MVLLLVTAAGAGSEGESPPVRSRALEGTFIVVLARPRAGALPTSVSNSGKKIISHKVDCHGLSNLLGTVGAGTDALLVTSIGWVSTNTPDGDIPCFKLVDPVKPVKASRESEAAIKTCSNVSRQNLRLIMI